MKKIGIFTGFFLPHLGGVERYTDKLVEQLKIQGYEVVIVTSNDGNYINYEQTDNYKIYRLPSYNIVKQRYPIINKDKEYYELIERIKAEKIDYYICNTRFYLTSLIGAKLAKENNKKLFIIEHGSNHFTVNNKVLDFFGAKYEHFLTNRLKKYNPSVYGVSERCNNWLKHFKIEATGVFYNSVDDKTYELFKNKHYIKNKKDKIIIGFVGRVIKEKGIILLLEVFERLSKEYKNIELYVAGNGPILEEVKSKYTNKKIHFVGKLNYEEVMSLYNDLDIFINPSMYPEGLPTSILEAGIMKSAIIATDRGGTIEVINKEKYGIIMEENEESLEKSLKLLLNDYQKIEDLKNNIQDRILKEFTWKETSKKVIKELKK